jgi:hypothetical protein
MDAIKVTGTSFSPDGSRLAIAFGDDSDSYVLKVQPEPPSSYLLVVPVAHPEATIYWSKVSFSHPQVPAMSGGVWSPDGNSLVYDGRLIHLPVGEACKLPGSGSFGGFVGPASVLVAIHSRTPGPPKWGIVDFQCAVQETWTGAQHLGLGGLFGDGRTVVLFDWSGAKGSNLILIPATSLLAHEGEADAGSRPLPMESGRRLHLESIGSNPVFMDQAICGLAGLPGTPTGALPATLLKGDAGTPPSTPSLPPPEQKRNVVIRCWDTQTGKQVRASRASGSGRASLSAGGGRIAIADAGLPGSKNTLPLLPVRSIWDLKSGKIIARWSPDSTVGSVAGFLYGIFTISADGHMVADASVDSVVVYRLP